MSEVDRSGDAVAGLAVRMVDDARLSRLSDAGRVLHARAPELLDDLVALAEQMAAKLSSDSERISDSYI